MVKSPKDEKSQDCYSLVSYFLNLYCLVTDSTAPVFKEMVLNHNVKNLCLNCLYGHTFSGKIIHRTATLKNRSENPEWGSYKNFSYDEDEEDDEPEILEKITLQENYSPTTSGQCFFPYPPEEMPPEFDPIPLTDCIVEKCNRFERIDV